MAPTIFGEHNAKRPRMRSEQFRRTHAISRAKIAARLGDSYKYLPARTPSSFTYGRWHKRQSAATADGDSEEQRKIRNAGDKIRTRRRKHFTAKTDNNDVVPVDQMDTDDEEVHSIISSQNYKKLNDCLDRHKALQNRKEPHLFSNKNNNNYNSNTPLFINNKSTPVLDNNNNNINSNDDECSGKSRQFAPVRCENQCKSESNTYTNVSEIKNAERLLEIAIKTIHLIKRNQLLQRRLAQLQLETKEFIASVMANPENSYLRDKTQKEQ